MAVGLHFEALPAKHGDCLFLTFKQAGDRPTRILVDGGPPGVFKSALKVRLEEERQAFDDETPLRLDAVMVSHIDRDHIAGVKELFRAMLDADNNSAPRPYKPGCLLHNGFDDLAGQGNGTAARVMGGPAAMASFGTAGMLDIGREPNPTSVAVLQSYQEAVDLAALAGRLSVPRNPSDRSLLTGKAKGKLRILTFGGVKMTIVGPLQEDVDAFQAEWAKEAPDKVSKDLKGLVSYADNSLPNLASIVALVEFKGKTILLTGDARGDRVLAGLEHAGIIKKGGKLTVDILKIPHHGSERDLMQDFFERIVAKDYVVSANGNFGNPDRASLEWFEAGTGSRKVRLHMTTDAATCDEGHRKYKSGNFDAATEGIETLLAGWPKRITVRTGPVSIRL